MPVWCVVDKTAPFARVYFTDPYSFDDWRRVFERLRGDSRFAFRRQIGVLSDRTEVRCRLCSRRQSRRTSRLTAQSA